MSDITHSGGCHCGRVRFEVDAPAEIVASRCNCSICNMTGFLHLIVPAERFSYTADTGALATYTFNTGVAKHHFCRTCGIAPFYRPRSHPEGVSVNLRCLDGNLETHLERFEVRPFDGRNWERSIGSLEG